MPACVRCGSRSIRFRLTLLAPFVYLATGRKPVQCPQCGWRGWLKHTGTASWTGGRRRRRSKRNGTSGSLDAPRDLQLTQADLERDATALPATVTAPAQASEPDLEQLDQDLQRHREEESARRAAAKARRGRDHGHPTVAPRKTGPPDGPASKTAGRWPPARKRSSSRPRRTSPSE